MVVRDFNINLASLYGQELDKGIEAAMSEKGLEDMSGHFLPRHKQWFRDVRTWDMHRDSREVRYRTDYILGTDSRLLQNIAVRDASNNMERYLVLGCLCRAAPDMNLRYLGRRTNFPVRPPETLDKADRMFAKIWWAIHRPPWWERHFQAWISPKTWSLIDASIEAH